MQELLQQARRDLKSGNLAAARLKADQAAKFHVNYGAFDDRPELVMESIAIRESQTDRAAAKDFGIEQAGAESAQGVSDNNHISQADSHAPAGTESASVIKVKKEQARALVRSSRNLKKGRIESARRKAKAAASLDVTYSIMEDRPELVLADIDRRDPSSSASIASSGSSGSGRRWTRRRTGSRSNGRSEHAIALAGTAVGSVNALGDECRAGLDVAAAVLPDSAAADRNGIARGGRHKRAPSRCNRLSSRRYPRRARHRRIQWMRLPSFNRRASRPTNCSTSACKTFARDDKTLLIRRSSNAITRASLSIEFGRDNCTISCETWRRSTARACDRFQRK